MVTRTTRFRVYVFKTIALAKASNKTFQEGTIIRIQGDYNRFKLAGGTDFSFDTPAVPTSKKFIQLPWYNSQPDFATGYAAAATATLTSAQLLQKYIITTSVAATTLTLPTAALLAAAMAAGQGTELNFLVDNTGGANTVTVAVGTGIVVGAGALTGNTTLTIAAGQIGTFKIFFKSAAAALLYRTL